MNTAFIRTMPLCKCVVPLQRAAPSDRQPLQLAKSRARGECTIAANPCHFALTMHSYVQTLSRSHYSLLLRRMQLFHDNVETCSLLH